MKTLKVINKGKQARHRLGVEFPPNEEVTIDVSNRQYITIKAVRDFEVETVEEKEQELETPNVTNPEHTDSETGNSGEQEEQQESGDDFFGDMTVDQSVQAVKDGKITVDEAIATEIQNKNRSTLLDELENMKEDNQ